MDEYQILVIEDNPTQRAALERVLTEAGYNVKTTDSVDKAIHMVGEGIDFVIAGVISGDISRIDLIKHWRKFFPDSPLPLIRETESVETLTEMIRAGGVDDLNHTPDPKQLLTQLMALLAACNTTAPPVAPAKMDGGEDHIIGRTPVMREVFSLIERSSHAFSTVLISGETGTGKDLVAQAIHRHSPRCAGPFIAINCAAIPDTLVESELFGYEKGAFSGATGARIGRLEAANGGTLFIDEIGDCALSVQAKLLRILENRVVTPLGGHREIKVDTRVLTATSRDLPAMLAQGRFREDLFYRINIINILVPPLRDRVADIPLLVRHFIERVNIQNHTSAIQAISPSAMQAILRHSWPGNVRELFHIIEGAMALADRDKTVLELSDLHIAGRQQAGHAAVTAQPAMNPIAFSESTPPTGQEPPIKVADMEQLAIQTALKHYGNNKTKAARAIGISVRTLQRKLARRETPAVVVLKTNLNI